MQSVNTKGATRFVRPALLNISDRHSVGLFPNGQDEMIDSLISQCQPGWSLPREFYSSETIYRADLDRLWRSGWLFAGHSCEIPQPGDFFTVEIDADSIIVIRGDDNTVRSLHNVCRHRGALICTEP